MGLNEYRLRHIPKILRWLPPGTPGKSRLARRLLGASLVAKDRSVIGRDGAEFIAPSLMEPVGFYLLIDGVYEALIIEFILERLRPGAVFVDIGANIGAFTIPISRLVGPSGHVIAIEPSPNIFPYLQRNIALNGLTNVSAIHCAAFDQDGLEVPFFEAPFEKFGMGSLGAQFHDSPVQVMARRLDSMLQDTQSERVDLIKVDVEGFEVSVFRGAEKLLTGNNPPVVIFEFCDWAEQRVPGGRVGDAQRLLRDWSYQIWSVKDMINRKAPLPNVLTSGSDMLVAIREQAASISHA